MIHGSPPLSMGRTFQDPQGIPKIVDSTEPYIYTMFFFYTYMPMIKFNL